MQTQQQARIAASAPSPPPPTRPCPSSCRSGSRSLLVSRRPPASKWPMLAALRAATQAASRLHSGSSSGHCTGCTCSACRGPAAAGHSCYQCKACDNAHNMAAVDRQAVVSSPSRRPPNRHCHHKLATPYTRSSCAPCKNTHPAPHLPVCCQHCCVCDVARPAALLEAGAWRLSVERRAAAVK